MSARAIFNPLRAGAAPTPRGSSDLSASSAPAPPAAASGAAVAPAAGASAGSKSKDWMSQNWIYVAAALLLIVIVVAAVADPLSRAVRPPARPAPAPAPAPPANLPAEQVAAYVAQAGGNVIIGSGSGTGVHKKKRALLIGINYIGTDNELRGCIDDVNNVRSLLCSKMGFPADGITMMTDNTWIKPTRANIIAALTEFARELQPGDTAVVWYSGHGCKDYDPALKRMDEAWCALDYATAGMLLGSDVRDKFVKPLAAGVSVFIGADACHQGSGMDFHFCTQKDADARSLGLASPPSPSAAAVPAAPAAPPAARNVSPAVAALLQRAEARAAALQRGRRPAVAPPAASAVLSPPPASPPASAREIGPVSMQEHAATLRRRAAIVRPNHRDIMRATHERLKATDAVGAALAAAPIPLIEEPKYAELPARAVFFGGCQDAATSADAFVDGQGQGAFTWSFLTAVQAMPRSAPLTAILTYMRVLLRSSGYTQIPQVSLSNSGVTMSVPLEELINGSV